MKKPITEKISLKRSVLLCILVVCITVAAVFGTITLSKYVKSFGKDEHTLDASSFYFSSDILKEGGSSISVYDWDFSEPFSVNLYNYTFGNENLFSEGTVDAQITLQPTVGNATLATSSSVSIPGGEANVEEVHIVATPADQVATFVVTAVSEPYEKVLSATITLNRKSEGGDILVSIEDTGATDSVATLCITTSPNFKKNTLSFDLTWNPAIVVPDLTNDAVKEATPLGATSYRFALKTGGSYRITLFKITSGAYSVAALPRSGHASGLNWSYSIS